METKDVGEIIQMARIRAGLTRRSLSYYVGLSEAVISKYESGYFSPSEEYLRKICNVLGLSFPLQCHDGEPEYEPVSCPHLYKRIRPDD